jgi:hypothetical protein
MRKLPLFIVLSCFSLVHALIAGGEGPQAPAGWTSHPEGDATVYTPDGLGNGEFTLTIYPTEQISGSVEDWFNEKVRADLARRGQPTQSGKLGHAQNGLLTISHGFRDQNGKPYLVFYNGIRTADQAGHFSIIRSASDLNRMLPYIKMGGTLFGQSVVPGNEGAPQRASAARPTTAPAAPATHTPPKYADAAQRKQAADKIRQAIQVAQPGTGVQPAQIAAVLHEGRGVSTVTGFQYVESVNLLLKDGWAYADLEIPPSDLNVEASRRLEPEKWHKWRQESKEKFAFEDQKTGKWQSIQAVVVAPLESGSRLNLKLLTRSAVSFGGFGGSTFTRTLRLFPDGRFERTNSALHGTGAMQSTNGFSGSAASYEDKNGRQSSSGTSYSGPGGNSPSVVTAGSSKNGPKGDHSGTYSVSGYTLELRSDNGDVQRLLAFYVFPEKGKDNVFIGNVTYSTPDK